MILALQDIYKNMQFLSNALIKIMNRSAIAGCSHSLDVYKYSPGSYQLISFDHLVYDVCAIMHTSVAIVGKTTVRYVGFIVNYIRNYVTVKFDFKYMQGTHTHAI